MLTWNRCQPAALVFLGKRQLLCAVMPPLLVMKFYLERERDGTSMELPQNRHTPTQVELNPSLESKTVECKIQKGFIVTKHFNSFNLKKEIWLDHSWQDCKVTLVYFIYLFIFKCNVCCCCSIGSALPLDFCWLFWCTFALILFWFFQLHSSCKIKKNELLLTVSSTLFLKTTFLSTVGLEMSSGNVSHQQSSAVQLMESNKKLLSKKQKNKNMTAVIWTYAALEFVQWCYWTDFTRCLLCSFVMLTNIP